jgi:uncharacterized membrane protein YdbT with pleckstrin-like domain
VVERWLGLAKIQVQTASGNASAEMTIEGLQHFERIRDWLYSRMRGAREQASSPRAGAAAVGAGAVATAAHPLTAGAAIDAAAMDKLARTLHAVAAEVRALRAELAAREAREEVPHA